LRGNPSADGSALFLVLVCLVVLSLLGLSLAGVASNERVLGANSRTLRRVLFAAESGVDLAAARALAFDDLSPLLLELEALELAGGTLRTFVEIDEATPVLTLSCRLCEINRSLEYGRQGPLWRVAIRVTSRGRRGSEGVGADRGSRIVTQTLDIQPWELPVGVAEPLSTRGSQR